jgi:arabinose-5-phosphate isomerase
MKELCENHGPDVGLQSMHEYNITEAARQAIRTEAEGVKGLLDFIDHDFERVVELILQSTGRLIVSGVGKSAIIAQKLVATFNSTGTPSLYLHAADAIHGDLGMVQPADVVMVISKSGNSPEIKVLVQLLAGFGNTLIGMVGNTESYLAKQAHYVLNTTVAREACPNNLAPTSSTTAQMVMGDAIAVCLMELRRFSSQDFARFHPGGTLGKMLYLRVSDLVADNPAPQVNPETTLARTVLEITKSRMGATAVVDADGTIYGIVTDGDLRRMLERNQNLEGITARDICSKHPKTIGEGELAVNALDLMRRQDISQLLVTNAEGRYAGMLHMHELLKEGLV